MLGNGDDTVTNTGSLIGRFTLGDGADTFVGGIFDDQVFGNAGNDTVQLRGGDDTFLAEDSDGNDIVRGGDGTDTYDASATTTGVTIDLDDGIAKGAGTDRIFGFENAIGSASAGDTLRRALWNELPPDGATPGFAGKPTAAPTPTSSPAAWRDISPAVPRPTCSISTGGGDRQDGGDAGHHRLRDRRDKIDLSTIDARTNLAGNQSSLIGAGAHRSLRPAPLHVIAWDFRRGDTNETGRRTSVPSSSTRPLVAADFAL